MSAQKEFILKLYDAEKNISIFRALVIFLNIAVYIFLMDKTQCIRWLAWVVIVVAVLYSFFTLVFHPYKRNPILLSAYFTSGSDALLITLWIIATGGYESPFYLLWYVSLLAIALRFTFAVTLITAALYGFLYLIVLLFDTDLTLHMSEIIVRFGYMFFVAMLGGFMSKEIIDQIEAKILLQKSKEEIKKREMLLKEARDHLEERVKERTMELNIKNKQLSQINEDIDNFVYSASHDLKAPLLNMEALMMLLNKEKLQASSFEKDLMAKMEMSINKMKNTINNLADVARSQKEVFDDIETIQLNEIAKEVLE